LIDHVATTERTVPRTLAVTELGPQIGSGLRADVHALVDGRAVKIFRPSRKLDRVAREFDVTRAARAAGAGAWRVYEIVRVDERLAIIGERVAGETYADALRAGRVSVRQALEALVSAQRTIGGLSVPAELAGVGRPLARTIGPSPVDPRLMAQRGFTHGDLSLDNLMIDAAGRTTILDWGSAGYGPLLADVTVANRALRRTLFERSTPLRFRMAAPAIIMAHRWLAFRALGLPITSFLLLSPAWSPSAKRRPKANFSA
jgi:aminoglycoside phosphotransferase (APT) family kinase protein